MKVLIPILRFLSRIAIFLRYRLEIKGLDFEKDLNRKGGILFLPNHPALTDPWIVFTLLWPKYRMRPLIVEYIYRIPLFAFFFRIVKGVSVPNFEVSINPMKVRRAEVSFQTVTEGLKRGENFIIYPAGKLKKQGKEVVGGASGAYSLLQACPDTNIVLIRTSGLWGSSFSRAILGRSPNPLSAIWNGIKVVLKNFIFFVPKRKILIEIEANPAALPWKGDKIEFNRYLEKWFNQYPDEKGRILDEEPLELVSYSFWRKQILRPFESKKNPLKEGKQISDGVKEKIYKEIQKILEKPTLTIKPEMNLALDLGMDSLNISELIAFLTRHYDVGEVHPEDLETVQTILELAEGIRVRENLEEAATQATWPKESKKIMRPAPSLPEGETIPESFLIRAQQLSSFPAAADSVSGVVSYKKLKRSALVLAQHFRKFPEEKIAILLPASVGAFITILALYFAKKIPVMLNWTLGPRYLEEMMNLSKAERIITSWRFVDRATHMDVGSLESKLIYLEDVRHGLSLFSKLRGAFLAQCSPSRIMKSVGSIDPNSPAVILFTSGTEASPKGVPLSHKNLLSNMKQGYQCLDFNSRDILYGILPPFHSFGFTVTGLLPILMGMRVVFYPNPTDSFALAAGIEHWKIPIFCSAPSFLRGVLQVAKPQQLKSLRLIVTGAEKASPELYEKAKKLGVTMIEGYGITECSPILAVVRPQLPPVGVGLPLPEVEVCTIHPETEKLLPPGTEGELCFRGPNVFSGYLGHPRDPFVEIDGKKWYRSGDIGYLDPKGNIILSGRYKRFTKVGGEMISLGAVEEVLFVELKKNKMIEENVPSIAVLADERNPDKSHLVLFTTIPIDKDRANEMISHSGMSRLIKISSVVSIDEIPLMGTGKTDYRKLQSMIP